MCKKPQPTDTYAEIVEFAQSISTETGLNAFRVVRQMQLNYESERDAEALKEQS